MDFVKFYIVQLVKSAASRIRLIDKEKEKLLSRLVARIENSKEIFPDLKMMERVVELEETASKLISIYRRLNKSHIDLEKISYQFASDRDTIQSTLRRFLQGNLRNGATHRRRPKIVFDDTTQTIYELNTFEEKEEEEPQVASENIPKIDLIDFLKQSEEKIEQNNEDITTYSIEQSQNLEYPATEEAGVNEDSLTTNEGELEIDNDIARKSLEKIKREKKEEKTKDVQEEELVLSLEFDWEGKNSQSNIETVHQTELEEKSIPDGLTNLQTKIETEETEKIFDEEQNEREEQEQKLETSSETIHQESETPKESLSINATNQVSERSAENVVELSQELIDTIKSDTENLYLDFEKMILDNILEVDDFLTKIVNQNVDDEIQLRILQKAHKCMELANQLQFDLISELIKVYWLSIVAIRDHRMQPTKSNAELIRSTLIILVTLIKQREIDLEPFMQKHNKLKELLKKLDYEV